MYQSDSSQGDRNQCILIFWGNSENRRWQENLNVFDSREHNFKAWSFIKQSKLRIVIMIEDFFILLSWAFTNWTCK